jgi:hydrogenase-4 component E
MSDVLFAQLVNLGAGVLLLSTLLMAWRRELLTSIRLLAVQGAALAGLVAVTGSHEGEPASVAVAVLVLALKGVVLPVVIARGAALTGTARADSSRVNPTAALLGVMLLTTLAYLTGQPLAALGDGPAARAVPIGIAMVLVGFLLLVTRRRAVSQLVGFLVLDNGIAAVACLAAAGVPLVVELGASLDVLLVVLILLVLSNRIQDAFGGTDLDELTELRD